MITTVRRIHGASLLALVLGASVATAQGTPPVRNDSVLMRAMRDELTRSIDQLRLDTLPKPYFIAYRVTEGDSHGASARLGRSTPPARAPGVDSSRWSCASATTRSITPTTSAPDSSRQSSSGSASCRPKTTTRKSAARSGWRPTTPTSRRSRRCHRSAQRSRLGRALTVSPISHASRDEHRRRLPPAAVPSRQVMETLARELSTTFRAASEL